MSALGDYVHYNQQNYINYGINKIGETPSESWEAAAAALKSQLNISSEIGSLMAEAQQLENQYNELFYPTQQTDETSLFISALEQATQEMLNQEFGLMAGKFNASNLSVDSTTQYNELKAAIDNTKSNIKIANLNKNSSLNTMNNTINKILDLLDQNEFKNISSIQPRLISAKAEAKSIQQKITQMAENGTGGNFQYTMKSQDIDTLNKIIHDFNRVPLLYNQSGALFEWILPFIGINLSGLGKQELVEVMEQIAKESFKGDTYVTIEMPDLLDNDLTDVDIEEGNVQMKTVSTRSKTDVVVSYTDENDGLQTKNVSAKSVSGKHIKLAQDTTLYRILLLSGSYDFATHYLNVITTSSGNGSVNMSQVLEANRLVKSLALKLGAEGYDINNASELLIVNNRAESHIYVYNLKALVYLIQQGMEEGRYTNLVKGLSDSYTINQDFADTPNHRIQQVIAATNGVKITAELGGSALNQYLSLLKS